MAVQVLLASIKQMLDYEKQALAQIENRLAKLEPRFNQTYFKLIAGAAKHSKRIEDLGIVMVKLRRQQYKDMIVKFGAKVQLVSLKVGSIIYLDTKYYFDLIGKQIGELVTMNNTTFMIAGIY